ncbi:uncharacterized protein [Rutidosis leptorrhynchoides]|uniref:uncharacterized protein n=1 Tax=Rutidosis leptorrhynchoides TaxID=125765 RepID=UPI003A99816E
MGDHIQQNAMNFDLNLVPDDHPPQIGITSDVISNHSTPLHRFSSLSRHIPVSALRLAGGNSCDNVRERPLKRIKTSDDCVDRNDNVSFFDCNICLDLANDPVVTCCGHLFCWACLYQWLFVHSKANECPNCKGEVTNETITPIYSRVNRTLKENKNSSVEIPSRPEANRIENWREAFQRDKLNAPMFDMIRRLDNRFDITRDPVPENPQEGPVTPLLDRIFTSRGIRRVRESHDRVTGYVTSADGVADLPNRMDTMPNLMSAESFVESYFRDHPDEQDEEEFELIDRHSMSSVAGIMQADLSP